MDVLLFSTSALAEALHDGTGALHYVIHEYGYDGDDLESVACIGDASDHVDEAIEVRTLLDAAGYVIVPKSEIEELHQQASHWFAENTKLRLALDAWKKHREVGCACKNPTGVALANISEA
jgi:hypothetical protein